MGCIVGKLAKDCVDLKYQGYDPMFLMYLWSHLLQIYLRTIWVIFGIKNCDFEQWLPGKLRYCSLNIPHPPFRTNATWLAKVRQDKIELPQWPQGFPQSWHPYDSYMSTSKHVEETNYTAQEILEVRKTYYAMCAEADYLLNRVWESLNGKGYGLDNTFVVYVSDHGEMNMEHRQVWKNSMYEASSRVPFAIAGPGIARGRRVTQLTSLVDVLPTLLDMGQESEWDKHAELAGKSVLLLAGATSRAPPQLVVKPEDDRAVFSQYHSNMGNTGSFMVRKGPWKYISFGHVLSTFAPQKYTPLLFNVSGPRLDLSFS